MNVQHPALPHKYDIVQFTRGVGIEVGRGVTADTAPLFLHFRKVPQDQAGMMLEPGSLDFVLVAGHEGTEKPQPFHYLAALKAGGYLVSSEASGLRIWQKMAGDAGESHISEVDLSVPPMTVCVVRYGGFGDMLQAANVFPALKLAGYRVVVMTTPQGADILKADPHIDEFLLQDTDQVPNEELTAYWERQATRFHAFVNLSESVEGTLLAYEGRANHAWPDAVRRAKLGTVNYLEFTSELAGVPYHSDSRFYPTRDETEAAERFLAGTRRRAANVPGTGPVNAPQTFNIMWSLSGSSIHKCYPHQDDVIGEVLRNMPQATITLVGDELCQLLEQGWENHPRVRCTSGLIGIRETLALALHMDCVVGPETGVLNAVAFEPMAKVIMLSHSSTTNLTKHWANTEALEPPTPCYPCHRLHYGRKFCYEHQPTGTAQCQWDIEPYRVFASIGRAYSAWSNLRDIMWRVEVDPKGHPA